MKKKTRTITEDSKYIQQHLANERTFLAWIRTAIAITGIGFLIVNLHIRSSSPSLSNAAVQIIGLLSVISGICTIVFSTISYFQKAKQINEQMFRTSRPLVLFLAMLMLIMTLLFGYYFIISLLK
jgi:putative membrane protein